MALEIRNGRPCFYKAQRENGKVLKIYVGSGDVALAAALAHDIQKERQELIRNWLKEAANKFAELDTIDAELVVELAAFLYASLGFRLDAQAARRLLKTKGTQIMEETARKIPLPPAEEATWLQLRERASRGDQEAAAALLPYLDKYPELMDRWGDLSRVALSRWLELLAGKDEVAIKATHGKVLALVASLQLDSADPLEGLLAQRVGLLWLQVHYFDVQLAAAMSRTPKEQEFLVKRQQGAQKAYDAAIVTLRDFQAGVHSTRRKPVPR